MSRLLLLMAGVAFLFSADDVFDTLLHDRISSVQHRYPGYLVTGIGATCILLGIFGIALPARLQPVAWLGKISYGLYVYHLPCILLTIGLTDSVFHLTSAPYVFAFLSVFH